MKKLLFVGHEFHKKTKSCDFLFEILAKAYEVEKCFLDPYAESGDAPLKEFAGRKFDVVLCWQMMPDVRVLAENISYKRGVFFPMYDGCPGLGRIERWYPFRNFQIISFSKTLYDDLKKSGFSAKYIQYFPKPAGKTAEGNKRAAFFWNRSEAINVNTVGKLFADYPLELLHVHKALDPQQSFIVPEKQYARKTEYSDWYEHKEDMMNDIAGCAFYVAPREKEGIGMSFLEAMAMGRAVIAPNQATMNEYIKDGENGYLYDLGNPEPLMLKDVRKVQKNCRNYIKTGYARWQKDQDKILTWIAGAAKPDLGKIRKRMWRRFFCNPPKVIKVWAKFGF